MIYWNVYIGTKYIDCVGMSEEFDSGDVVLKLEEDGYKGVHVRLSDKDPARDSKETSMARAFGRAYERLG